MLSKPFEMLENGYINKCIDKHDATENSYCGYCKGESHFTFICCMKKALEHIAQFDVVGMLCMHLQESVAKLSQQGS